jgi:prepilin-type N-terminal cleavage/methylation domain-containing protein
MRRAGQSADGFTLVELLVATAVVGLVMAGVLGVLVMGLEAYRFGADRVEAQQTARAALERMVKELREAGYDPAGGGVAPIVLAEPTQVAFQRDLNANGVIDATRERVTFLLRGTVLRRDAGGGAQPLAENVRAFGLSYLDGAGAETADLRRIRAIRIRLEVGEPGRPAAVVESEAALRNVGH